LSVFVRALTITHNDFNLTQIDYIVFQFDSRNGVGNNFTINEIRVE